MDRPVPLIRLSGICFGYPERPRILENADLSIFAGERLGLLGPNGAGKTTLFHLIMGLLAPQAGTVEVFGKVRKTPAEFQPIYGRAGLLFQDPDDQLFCPTVLEDVAFGPLNLGKSPPEAEAISRRTLEYLGLSGFEDRITHRLSGGEKRLVSLATVLSMEPEVLLLDEPSTGLDDKTKARLIRILNGLEIAYMVISHESDFLLAITDTIYQMEDGVLSVAKKPKAIPHA